MPLLFALIRRSQDLSRLRKLIAVKILPLVIKINLLFKYFSQTVLFHLMKRITTKELFIIIIIIIIIVIVIMIIIITLFKSQIL